MAQGPAAVVLFHVNCVYDEFFWEPFNFKIVKHSEFKCDMKNNMYLLTDLLNNC